MDLLVRASRNDHTVIEHFLTPSTAGTFATRRKPIDAVVADATVAVRRSQLRRITTDAGTPYLIDPLTSLLQTEQAPDDSWATLSFAQADPLGPGQLSDYVLDELIDRTITFEREHGATHLIPPYFYSNKRDDVWWTANLAVLRRTGQYLAKEGIDLPVIPVFAASLREYGPETTWQRGLDSYLSVAGELNTEAVALSWSWNDPTHSKRAPLSLLLGATAHAATLSPVVGWRAGTYGLALAAVGAAGYETGIGEREHLHYVDFARSHKPRLDGGSPHGQAYTYFSDFGRSVPRRAGEVLLRDPQLTGSLVCDPSRDCCSGGVDSMLNEWREHTVRERRRELDELAQMPAAWRMHRIERGASRAAVLASNANQALERAEVNLRIADSSFTALQEVAATYRASRAAGAA